MAENGPVRGTIVIRPYGYSIWERMQENVDRRIKQAGASNAYFPLFIPQSYLQREAEHVEGFSPELAVVTHAGGDRLEEPIVVRPTSETVVGEYMAKWVQSYRDLPLLLNQWANVVRWELRPRLFLRTSEFLWQEGHTAHGTKEEAAAYARQIHLDVYRSFLTDIAAIPVLVGHKTPRERFAGAINTLTCEAMMADGKALQIATSHELGQNFARAFGIDFLGQDGQRHLAWTTSWGSSTRMVGGLVMAHGDDRGLRIPPRLAPIQVVVVAVRNDQAVSDAVEKLVSALSQSGVRAISDIREGSFGRRVTEWELKGIPLRLEIGPRDLGEGRATIVRRDLPADVAKSQISLQEIPQAVKGILEEIQAALYDQALARQLSLSTQVDSVGEAIQAAEKGFAYIPKNLVDEAAEEEMAASAVTVRCVQRPDGSLADSEDEEGLVCVVARSY